MKSEHTIKSHHCDGEKAMRVIELQTGVAALPHDWEEVLIEHTGKEDFIGVVEMRKGDFPHFFYRSETETLSEELQKEILTAIVAKHPWFKSEVIDKQIAPIWEDGEFINAEEWDAAPTIGFFLVPDASPEETLYPFGAMIVRSGSQEG